MTPLCENLISTFSDLIEPYGLLPRRAERESDNGPRSQLGCSADREV